MTQFEKPNHADETNSPGVPQSSNAGFGAFPSGSGLNKYRILERIGSSNYAITYLARDSLLDRLVTVKQLNPNRIDDPVACADFKHEARLLAKLSNTSRNVSRIHELIGDENGLFIVCEHVFGESLELKISKKLITANDALKVLRSGCLALSSLQHNRIVHRDACPKNWAVNNSNALILTNFSTASTEGDDQMPEGINYRYAAPELLRNDPTDCRADVYSFGMILYEICVSRLQFKNFCRDTFGIANPDDDSWRAWHLDERALLPDPRELNHQISGPLAAVIGEMTRKDVDERISSAEAILQGAIRRLSSRGAIRAVSPPLIPSRETTLNQLPSSESMRRVPSLNWLVDNEQTTTTASVDEQTVHAKRGIASVPKPRIEPALSESDLALGRPRVVQSRSVNDTPRAPVKRRLPEGPVVPPKPVDVEEPSRIRTSLILTSIAVVVILGAVAFSSLFTVNQLVVPTKEQQQMAGMIEQAKHQIREGETKEARSKLLDLKTSIIGHDELQQFNQPVDVMLMILDAERAIDGHDFAAAEKLLLDATLLGAEPDIISQSKQRLEGTRDMIALESRVNDLLNKRDFTGVELAIDEYRESAIKAGRDPEKLSAQLEKARIDRKYRETMELAESEMDIGNFENAVLAARDAISIKDTSESRHMLTRIYDRKRQNDHRIRGDRAFSEAEFTEAEREYQLALDIEPNEELETRLRTATAARLLVEANEAVAKGDLLHAQRLLKNSMWQKPSTEAQELLRRLAPAFEAAELVRRADLALKDGDKATASRLYRTAIPNLPSPAREITEGKLSGIKN